MKRIVIFLVLLSVSVFGFAQATFPIQAPGEAAVSVTLSADAVTSITAFLQTVTVGIAPTTLSVAALVGDTTYTLTSATGVMTGMGLLVGSEVSLVTNVAGNVVTVTRGRIGTMAAAHVILSPVTVLRSGSYSVFIANTLADAILVSMTASPAATIAAQNTAIANAQATIKATVAAGVSHVP